MGVVLLKLAHTRETVQGPRGFVSMQYAKVRKS